MKKSVIINITEEKYESCAGKKSKNVKRIIKTYFRYQKTKRIKYIEAALLKAASFNYFAVPREVSF